MLAVIETSPVRRDISSLIGPGSRTHSSLGLEKQNCNVAEVEVDKVFRLCTVISTASTINHPDVIPCVTKLPKLRPTMQCQVAPFRWSNWRTVSLALCDRSESLTSRLMCCAMSLYSHNLCTASRPYLLDRVLLHGLLRCVQSDSWIVTEIVTPYRRRSPQPAYPRS
jgi:hypothetical protein